MRSPLRDARVSAPTEADANKPPARGSAGASVIWRDGFLLLTIRPSGSCTGDYRVARAAYEEAVKRRPGRIVTLRQKTRLLADSRSLK